MPLTHRRIAELAENEGVQTDAAENFLETLGSSTREQASANLERDATAYGWNDATIQAIVAGIREAYEPARKQPKKLQKTRTRVDREWQREEATQLGMGLGVEAYNDAMGWGSDD